MPVVSPNEMPSAPSASARPATSTTRATGTSPSYGQPNAVDTMTWQVAPGVVRGLQQLGDVVERLRGRAVDVLAVVRVARRDDDLDLAEAGVERALRAPQVGHQRRVAHRVGRSIAAQTSSASAICGIAFGWTNDTASIRPTPVRDSASMSATLASVGTGASFCRPSRGPTSRRLIRSGRSLG